MNAEMHVMPGEAAREYERELAELRINVFREYPYLYEGNKEYEAKYLETYFKSEKSCIIIAVADDQIVGASTSILLSEGDEDFKRPFLNTKFNLDEIVYFGESVLLPDYRGRGLGRQLLQLRENFATMIPGVKYCAFCSVIRSPEDPRKPKNYRSLEDFWQRYGYRKESHLKAKYKWLDLGEKEQSEKEMQFWIKELDSQ